jgi:hypothetical protein
VLTSRSPPVADHPLCQPPSAAAKSLEEREADVPLSLTLAPLVVLGSSW